MPTCLSQAVTRRRSPASSGTATRTWSGRPKLAQSRTSTPWPARPARARAAPPGAATRTKLASDGATPGRARAELRPALRRRPRPRRAGRPRASRSGRAAAARPLTDQRAGGRRDADQSGVGSEDVARPETGAGEHLGQGADDHRLGVTSGPAAGGQRVERLVPHLGVLADARQAARGVVRVRATRGAVGPRPGRPSRSDGGRRGRTRPGWPPRPAEVGAHQGDGLGPPVGQQHPVGRRAQGVGDGLGGCRGVGITAQGVEVAGGQRGRRRAPPGSG